MQRHTVRKEAQENRSQSVRSAILAASLLISGTPGATPASAQVVCGQRIGPNETVVIENDLDCAFPFGLEVSGPGATLDLNGNTLTCTDPNIEGIILTGQGAKVRNGVVDGCLVGIVIEGSGRHRVEDMLVHNTVESGVVVGSDRNQLRRITVAESGEDGVMVSGQRNTITDSTAVGNSNVGFSVLDTATQTQLRSNRALRNAAGIVAHGSGSQVRDNTANANGEGGIGVFGSDQEVRGNTASGNDGLGFFIVGEGHQVRGNTAEANRSNGFEVDGEGHRLEQNAANTNGRDGFEVEGEGHRVERNQAIRNVQNGIQLIDDADEDDDGGHTVPTQHRPREYRGGSG